MNAALFYLMLAALQPTSPAATGLPQLVLPSVAPAPDSSDILVFLDGNPLSEQQEYVLERDMTYSLKVQNLKPNSNVEVKVKFAGGLGQRRETHQADRHGEIIQLFDTPNRRGEAQCTVAYTTANGTLRERTFRLRVQ
jgi:hypothetical protein